MKKIVKVSLVVVMILSVCLANTAKAQVKDQFKAGLSLNVSAGGDLEKTDLGIGAQIIVPVTDLVSIEVSGTQFEDGAEFLKVDVTHIAATLRLSTQEIQEKYRAYGGIGFNWNQFDAEVGLPGFTVQIEDAFGAHVALGASMKLAKNVELFCEGRYVLVKSLAEIHGPCSDEVVKDDANFGLVRIGVNYLF